MTIGIGIDTGGTYTDVVAYDFDTAQVIAKGKALTTREDLAVGIGNALDVLPGGLLTRVDLISLSTTLATNACVENKGGRAKLLLIGGSQKLLLMAEAERLYGLDPANILCVQADSSFDGRIVDIPDWDQVSNQNSAWISDAQGIGITDIAAVRNGGVSEKTARDYFKDKYKLQVIISSELVSGLNVMERAATALLNARLLPVIDEFHKAVSKELTKRGAVALPMTVRSDGSLMSEEMSRSRPVETILSGPAASVLGGKSFAENPDCLIIDMGGTTTDISIVEKGSPAMTGGISIGGWRTQIKGVFIDTFGLGGDSRIIFYKNSYALSEQRAKPVCVAASRYPEIKQWLRELLARDRAYPEPLHEFFILLREPDENIQYDAYELDLISRLKKGPVMPSRDSGDWYRIRPNRLEQERIILRCGLTPTDIMHIKGDFKSYDTEASILAARYFLRALPELEDTQEGLAEFCTAIYDKVEERLYCGVVRALINLRQPELKIQAGDQASQLIEKSWHEYKLKLKSKSNLKSEANCNCNCSCNYNSKGSEEHTASFFEYNFKTKATLVGIGAPTYLFLPNVAMALSTDYIIPEHAGVANALGAVLANVIVTSVVEVTPCYSTNGLDGYIAHCSDKNRLFDTTEEAIEVAIESAKADAYAEARKRGALGELSLSYTLQSNKAYAKDGTAIDLGTTITAKADQRSMAPAAPYCVDA